MSPPGCASSARKQQQHIRRAHVQQVTGPDSGARQPSPRFAWKRSPIHIGILGYKSLTHEALRLIRLQEQDELALERCEQLVS
jgi:hypothetical protein